MRLLLVITALTLGSVSNQTMALTQIGKADSVVKSVKGTADGTTKPLSAGDQVFQDQVIETGAASRANLVFEDETKFSVGPNAKAVLDTFVYDPKTKDGEVLIKASQGAFRFVSGLGKKKNYLIKTPTASIGVRGTTFHMFILATGTTAIALEEGTVIICNLNNRCQTASTPGRVTFVLTSGRISREIRWGERYMRQVTIDRAFPFLRDREPFQGRPRDGGSAADDGSGADVDTKESNESTNQDNDTDTDTGSDSKGDVR